jgi:hypothetical protein
LEIESGTCIVDFVMEIGGAPPKPPAVLTVTVDASLPKRPDGSIINNAACYPFVAPTILLSSGQSSFPAGSTIHDGMLMSIDLDWTPSLHLTDAIMNVSLKVKESILQGEPFHAASPEPSDPLEDTAKAARRFASTVTKGATSFGKGAATSLTKAFSPLGRQPRKKEAPKKNSSRTGTTPGDIRIGDEINMLDEPWVEAHGVYSCKAIRRPGFVAKAIEAAEQNEEQQSFSSPTAMFRSFTKSARSVLEETFLMITESHIIELKASKLHMNNGTVVFCIPIDMMTKLKFRRQESLSLFFKASPDEPLIYMCPDSGDAVHQIQSVLKRHGVKGKHTNAAAYRAINEAMQLVQEIQTKELALNHDPSVERVNDIMDLYRQAAERFEAAGDLRHEEVVTHMRKFLALPLTASILDGSFVKPPPSPRSGELIGEVLERTDALIKADDLDGPESKANEKANDKLFEENIDNLLTEAKEDFEKFKMTDDPTMAVLGSSSADLEDSGLADVAADLDAMMREADKEMAELMNA